MAVPSATAGRPGTSKAAADPAAETLMLRLLSEADRLSRRLPPLQVGVPRVAQTVAQGVHGRRRVGIGETFWQFRPYEIGDAINRIDWRQSAKSDRLSVRQTEWEAAQTVYLWCDPSASMGWSSDRRLPVKGLRARVLTLALTDLLIRAGEQVALLGSADRPGRGRQALFRIARDLGLPEARSPLPKTIPEPERNARPLAAHASVILVSDFLDDLAAIERAIGRMVARRLGGLMLQVLDPAEEDLPYDGRVQFLGLEGEGQYLIPRVSQVRESYHRRIQAQAEGLAQIARRAGWTLIRHRTDHGAQTALLAAHTALAGLARNPAVGRKAPDPAGRP